ncbi:hypothetical protein ACN38_g2563 [Penicillium nordicum]|uniref:Uncharacterized protein n=1 Tax=Penicillium nordicum TaxID=229535 RepID=A0A0M9WIS8_9EURO|nr:hypothetical protein ACN38_g2563 [Penicillium nordicum]
MKVPKKKKKSLPRGIEPRSPALIGVNDKRKSSPLDQGRCDGRVTARPLGWLMTKAPSPIIQSPCSLMAGPSKQCPLNVTLRSYRQSPYWR